MLLAQLSPLVMTSGKRAEEPIAYTSAQLEDLLGESADGALDHNRPILRRCDDSVLKIVREQPLILRRSRGLVPDPISLPLGEATVLACGADLKNVIGVTRARELFLSQHIGDLEDWRAFDFFRATITDFLALLRVRPALVVHDLHPAYHSTRYAQTPEAPPAPRLAVQHHHAHIAACMAEHQLTQPLIGVALDGTGYGADGTLWGGEFLSADLDGYRRLAHFKAYPLPGGAAAIQQPARMAFSMLQAELPPQEADQIAASQLDYSAEECAALRALMQARGHAPLSSSAGRLFDAVAALLGLGTEISYEARGAIRLQSLADPNANGHYPFRLIAPAAAAETAALPRPSVLSFGPMLQALIAEQRAGVDPARLAGKFHNTVARAVVQVCIQIQAAQGLKAVALSGGVFQNELLLDKVRQGLLQEGFQVYSHRVVPPNDGGIALGQAALGLQWMARRPQLANSNH
ncbi:MAG: carbamoyltransferase HypF [Lentisphaerae bacterium]|nr:carbamoyltransferase HypF [Lentisphaerota bacterium]